jgi:gamma-glutamyltranspeptidase/glutathione hydrolase
MAETLEDIASSKGESFYRGTIAERIALASEADDGAMRQEDLAQHKADWVDPIAIDYRGYQLHEMPPNGQGIAALIALGILRNFDMSSIPVDSADCYHLQLEAMKLAFADVWRNVADPAAMKVTTAEMLDAEYLKGRAKLIDMKRAQAPSHGIPRDGGTVYLTTADEKGMMLSFIQSNYKGFGSGVVVPGTGISLQNRGAGFSLERGHPNEVAGGKRPFHTIIPGFVTRNGAPLAAFGVMGGPIQPPGHVQTVVRMTDYAMNPQAALDAPRFKVNAGRSIDLEATASPELREGLIALGHRLESVPDSYMDFGAGQIVMKTATGYAAASDPRRDGQAAGF